MYINNNEILDTDAIDIIEEELKEELCMAELCMVIPHL